METKWTNEPPTEPGWYWCRSRLWSTRVREIWRDDGVLFFEPGGGHDPIVLDEIRSVWEWWPIRIEHPPI